MAYTAAKIGLTIFAKLNQPRARLAAGLICSFLLEFSRCSTRDRQGNNRLDRCKGLGMGMHPIHLHQKRRPNLRQYHLENTSFHRKPGQARPGSEVRNPSIHSL